jgi:O-antigen biosynthesis protein
MMQKPNNSGKSHASVKTKNISLLRNVVQTLFKLLSIIFRSPIRSLSYLNFNRIRIFFVAIKNESPQQISKNFNHLIKGETSHLEDETQNFQAYNKTQYLNEKRNELERFIASNAIIDFTESNPVISIVLVFFNQAALSLACLKSIKSFAEIPYQLIIVDNNSTDDTSIILSRIKGATIIKNKKNLHFIHACNQAIPYLKPAYTLFLNNDVELLPHSVKHAYEQISSKENCGAIGAKIIQADGKLQEAGSIIWSDGTCVGYGRGKSPQLREFNFKRSVDYCSAAFLLTRTELFKKHGGFDSVFEPAYYEETDYCLWLQEKGYQVVYHPQIAVRHFEFGSGSMKDAMPIIERNHKTFYKKNKIQLANHQPSEESNIALARFAASQHYRKRILYVDARIPHLDYGAGFPRSNSIVNIIANLNFYLTIYPIHHSDEHSWEERYRDIDHSTEIISSNGFEGFKAHFSSWLHYYDYLWISRAHDLKALKKFLSNCDFKGKIIYDSEAIYAERKINKMKLEGHKLSQIQIQSMIGIEIKQADFADKIITVSETDALKFKTHGIKNTTTLGHYLKVKSKGNSFESRKDLLFVGNLDHNDSPNVDSILWFTDQVWPILKSKIPELKLHVIGSFNSEKISKLKTDGVQFHGRVRDLTNYYNSCRIFIAPTRFAAGIPYKIHEAASYHLPVVATKLLGLQLRWRDEHELILSEVNAHNFAEACLKIYDDKILWETIQKNSATKMANEHSENKYIETITKILN